MGVLTRTKIMVAHPRIGTARTGDELRQTLQPGGAGWGEVLSSAVGHFPCSFRCDARLSAGI